MNLFSLVLYCIGFNTPKLHDITNTFTRQVKKNQPNNQMRDREEMRKKCNVLYTQDFECIETTERVEGKLKLILSQFMWSIEKEWRERTRSDQQHTGLGNHNETKAWHSKPYEQKAQIARRANRREHKEKIRITTHIEDKTFKMLQLTPYCCRFLRRVKQN